MAIAQQTLEHLSEDPRMHRLARDREDEIKLNQIERSMELADSLARGRVQVLLELLVLRFGPLSPATQTELEAIMLREPGDWTTRILKAATLDELFG